MVKRRIIRSSSDELTHVMRKIEKYTHRYDRLIVEKKTAAVMSMYFDPPCSLLPVVPQVSPLGTRCYWMGKSQPNDTSSLS